MTKNRDIRHELEHRILLLDGGFGTMIQQYGLDEADYRGKEFAASEKLLRGCNDLLNLTRPETIREIHEKYLQAGSDVRSTPTPFRWPTTDWQRKRTALTGSAQPSPAKRRTPSPPAIRRSPASWAARWARRAIRCRCRRTWTTPAPGLSLSNSSRRRTTIRPGA